MIRVELDYRAVGDQILYSDGVRRDLEARAARVASRAGDGFTSKVSRGRDRYRGTIWSATLHAKRGEAKDHRLLKSLDAAR